MTQTTLTQKEYLNMKERIKSLQDERYSLYANMMSRITEKQARNKDKIIEEYNLQVKPIDDALQRLRMQSKEKYSKYADDRMKVQHER